MNTLYIIIPAYNEEENIENVINDWYPLVEKVGNGSKLLVIDDGSRDSTYSLLKKQANQRENLLVITKANSGHGATLLLGYRFAIKSGADYIFQTDGDGQTLPEEFWPFWDNRKYYDMVIGNRRGRQDGVSRVAVTKVLKLIIMMFFGVTIKDANTPYRLMKSSILEQNIKIIPRNHNLSNVMISVIYSKKGLKVKNLSITFRLRQGGVNSIDFKKIFKIGKDALIDFRVMNRKIKKHIQENQVIS